MLCVSILGSSNFAIDITESLYCDIMPVIGWNFSYTKKMNPPNVTSFSYGMIKVAKKNNNILIYEEKKHQKTNIKPYKLYTIENNKKPKSECIYCGRLPWIHQVVSWELSETAAGFMFDLLAARISENFVLVFQKRSKCAANDISCQTRSRRKELECQSLSCLHHNRKGGYSTRLVSGEHSVVKAFNPLIPQLALFGFCFVPCFTLF